MAMKVGRRNESGTGTDVRRGRENAREADGYSTFSEEEVRRMIAEAAYLRAVQRGFAPGGDVDDWLAAEQEVSTGLDAAGKARQQETAITGGTRTRKAVPAKTAPAEVKAR